MYQVRSDGRSRKKGAQGDRGVEAGEGQKYCKLFWERNEEKPDLGE